MYRTILKKKITVLYRWSNMQEKKKEYYQGEKKLVVLFPIIILKKQWTNFSSTVPYAMQLFHITQWRNEDNWNRNAKQPEKSEPESSPNGSGTVDRVRPAWIRAHFFRLSRSEVIEIHSKECTQFSIYSIFFDRKYSIYIYIVLSRYTHIHNRKTLRKASAPWQALEKLKRVWHQH